MAKIPNLNRYIEVYNNTPVDDGIGGVTDSWSLLVSIWSEIRQISDTRALIYGGTQNTILRSFIVRYRNDFSFDRDMVIKYRGQDYNVIDVKEYDERYNYVELIAATKA